MRQTQYGHSTGFSAVAAEPTIESQWTMMFTNSDILRIAACAENRVADFYEDAARRFTAGAQRDFCLEIAGQNRRHARYWSRTQAGLHRVEGTPVPSQEFKPETMVGLTWLGDKTSSRDRLTGHEDTSQILRDAHRRIRNLTTFYEGLKGFASNQAGIAMIDRIVRMARRQCARIEQQRESDMQQRRRSPSQTLSTSVFLN